MLLNTVISLLFLLRIIGKPLLQASMIKFEKLIDLGRSVLLTANRITPRNFSKLN